MSITWMAGKKAATGIEHTNYYWILHTEFSKVNGIVEGRMPVAGRQPLVEGIAWQPKRS
jgi:hypothetical protein